MARKKSAASRVNRTTFATSGYRSNMRAASTSNGGAIGRGGRAINRSQRHYDMRIAFGLAVG